MTTATNNPEFDVTESTHRHCRRCANAANSAADLAKVTGSTGSTYAVVNDDGTEHRATVKRVRCNSGRSDCLCPLCVKLAGFQPADPFADL